jgi:hypothetical protein
MEERSPFIRDDVKEHTRLPVSCASSLKMICVGERLKVPLYEALESYSVLHDGFASLSSSCSNVHLWVAIVLNSLWLVLVSNEQATELNLPRSIARIFMQTSDVVP